MKLPAEFDRFRQQIEKCNADDRTCAEAQDQMQLIVQAQRQQSAAQRAAERRGGDDYE